MFDKGVAKTDMHFVVSSGAQKEPKTTIISNELKKMGYVVNLVTPDQEAKLAFRATVPASFSDNSFMVDIGSGNTKVSWDENGTLRSIELPGAKYFEKGVSDEEVYNQVKSQMAKVPEGKRNVGFILGGVPFTLAKQHIDRVRKGIQC
jgi:ABC-type transport system substrate-binding protein